MCVYVVYVCVVYICVCVYVCVYICIGTPHLTALMLHALQIEGKTSKKMTTCFITVVWSGTCNISVVCLYMHIHACTYMFTQTQICMLIYVSAHTCIFTYAFTHVPTAAHTSRRGGWPRGLPPRCTPAALPQFWCLQEAPGGAQTLCF